MIFVTVGTQLPFDRLVMAVDGWALKNPDKKIFAQIGHSNKSKILSIANANFLKPTEAEEYFKKASIIVSHAGVGSILSALKYKKPLLIMPRLASLQEHRNDHQLATAKWVSELSGIKVAWNEEELVAILNHQESMIQGDNISDYASEELLKNLKYYIWDRRKSSRF